MAAKEQRVLVSGIKPTGVPHLGNLVGMLRPAASLTEECTSFLFVADLHALTTTRNGKALREHVYDDVAALLALEVDPARTTLFRQSDVPEILELAWVLGCLAPTSMLRRAHAFKAATAEGMRPSLGLFSYPVLMAADILALGGTLVPVGADQLQHLEMTRNLARRFNHAFGTALALPQPLGGENVVSLPGLDGRKMSKRYGNTIPLTASPARRRRLVMKIVTDSSPMGAPTDPEQSTVMAMLRAFESSTTVRSLAQDLRTGRAGWAEAKDRLAAALDRDVEPIRRRFLALRGNESRLESVLQEGATCARLRAAEVLRDVRQRVGIGSDVANQSDRGRARLERRLDEALAMTFPASDPVALDPDTHGVNRRCAGGEAP